MLSENFLKKYKNIQPNWGFNGLGYIVYKRTYSRSILDEHGKAIRSEQWWETVKRCVDGAQAIGANYTKDEAETLFDHVFNLRCNFAGRMLWQLGTETVQKFGANSLVNCWMTVISKPEDFCFLFENLMLGGGVGFSIRREDVHEFPRVKRGVKIEHENTKDTDFIVPDSRKGWIALLRNLLRSFFETGESFNYSTILIRGAGEIIRGFGGVASGPKILIEGIEKICKILQAREGKKIRSIDALDICNIIGSIVVSGNVRRSAEIALGDPDDILYLRAKRWDLGIIPNWRGMSNNSIYADDFSHVMNDIWEGYHGNGEPYGFFNLPLAEEYGRLGEKRKDNCVGMNPCGEISLADKECCDLGELYLNNISSKAELIECASLIYKTLKAIAAMPFLHEDTNKIVHKNMRLGIGVTGICQSQDKLAWLDDCYKHVRKLDKEWSKQMGWPESIKLTTVKPSGTLSLLAGSTPGAHPAYAQHYIRRVRMAANDAIVNICKDHGYFVEYLKNQDGSLDHNTVCVEFPCQSDEKSILAKDVTAIQQLEMIVKMQTEWSDNSVSVTVYYRPEELEQIKEWLKKNYKDSIKSVSFLRHQNHNFVQAPYEQIDAQTYEKLVKNIKPFKKEESISSDGAILDSLECAGGACPIK